MKSLNWKKNLLSYAAWLVCLLLTVYGGLALVRLWFPESAPSGGVIPYGIFGGVLLLAGLLNVFVWLLRKKRGGAPSRWVPAGDGRIKGFLEGFLCLMILALGMYLRWEKMHLANGAEYFEMASIKAGQGMPILLHGAEQMYVSALHGICFVLGNSLFFCVWFQLVLQVLAGLVCLLGVRRLTGSFSAILFAAYYFLAPGMIDKAVTLSPEPLFLLCFGIGLLAAGGFLKKSSVFPLGYFLTGMVIAFNVYLDASGLALFGILLTVFFVEREEPEKFWNRPAVSLLIALAGFGVFLAGIFAVDAYVSASTITKVAGAWGKLYFTAGNPSVDPLKLFAEMRWGRELVSLLFLLLSLGLFSFFFKRKQERTSVWVLAGGILFFLEMFGMTAPSMNGGEIFLLCLCALSGTALSNYGRETVLEKPGMRKWDPSLYGIVEDSVENKISEENVGSQYSEGEYEESGSTDGEYVEEGYAEGEYVPDNANRTAETESAGGDRNGMSVETASREQSAARENGNIIARILEKRNRKKEQQRQEMERVLSVLSSLSEDAEVSISPDHEPGEELVKGPAGKETEKSAENSRPADGKRKGFRRRKADTSAKKASRAAEEKTDSRGEKESAGGMPGRESEALDDGRKPLHNPLPVPKKKAATMLDYDYEVSEDDDYDYD